ncbi:DUF6883 domain-containing protein [Tunicatimonas pelagia]|uniref:DUF6883 domain-containing protein n=1 Tax=Tunicatimonas pelagia TaxID=931531 RepID=UPI002666BBAC|nr:DUF6883 domain-containing protein [Tunicatimonas pelagia]WKN42115.1 hypothetical protein P0M28_24060 [Tunicatimonas pelagia]
MSLLPNYEEAFIAIEKLADYCLNSFHPVGKDKARVFKSVLGLTRQDANLLKEAILETLPKHEASFVREDQYGKRYTVDIKIRNLDKEAIVRTGWIIKKDEGFPKLTSCYVK